MRALPLHNRQGHLRDYAMVDDDEKLPDVCWSLNGQGYVQTSEMPPRKLHRIILGLEPGDGLQADHINGNRRDNRRSNLRVVTHQQNQENHPNLRSSNRSGYRGVSWCEDTEKWRARVNGVTLGRYDTAEQAHEIASAYREMHMPYSEDARKAVA